MHRKETDMTHTTKVKRKKAKARPGPDEQRAGLSPSAAEIVSAADEDPAVVAAREAADAAQYTAALRAVPAPQRAPDLGAAVR